MPILARTDFTLGARVLVYGAAIGFGILAVWDTVDSLGTRNFEHLCLISIPLITACAMGFVYAVRHELVLSDTELVQYGFRSKHISLEEIESIVENLGAYEIKSANKSIRITTDLQNKNLFKDRMIAQIQEVDARKNQLPGRRLNADDQSKIFEQIQHMINTGIETDTLFKADTSLFEQLTEPAYYLAYEHPIHSFLNRAYDTEGEQVNDFLNQRTDAATAPGASIFVMPHHLGWLILCLDDGEILVKTAGE